VNYLPGLTLNSNPSDLSKVARVTGASHWWLAKLFPRVDGERDWSPKRGGAHPGLTRGWVGLARG
jgi:hypothetical protein